LHAEKLALKADRFIAPQTKLAFTAEKIALNRDTIANPPFIDVAAELADNARNFSARRARKLHGNRQPAFFEPQIKPVQAAGAHFYDDFVCAGLEGRQISNLKSAGGAVADQLKRAHAALNRIQAAA
jgi:hypothetical protein